MMLPTICLTMIVRDEERTIKRCLDSVTNAVDCYAIIDTGSKDRTLEIIRSTLAHLPGTIEQRKWSGDFSRHRNQSLALCRQVVATLGSSDPWALFLDADESLLLAPRMLREFVESAKTTLLWYANIDEYNFLKTAAVHLRSNAHWVGEVHETLHGVSDQDVAVLPGASIAYGSDGNRRRVDPTLHHDLSALISGSSELRGAFWTHYYLARTFESRSESLLAEREFVRAYDASTCSEHRFQSLWGQLRCVSESALFSSKYAQLAERMLEESNAARAEPLCALGELAFQQGQHREARALALAALRCALPSVTTMYDAGAYSWKPRILLASYSERVNRLSRAQHYLSIATQFQTMSGRTRNELDAWIKELREKSSRAGGFDAGDVC